MGYDFKEDRKNESAKARKEVAVVLGVIVLLWALVAYVQSN